jgi:hypothetical protein
VNFAKKWPVERIEDLTTGRLGGFPRLRPQTQPSALK